MTIKTQQDYFFISVFITRGGGVLALEMGRGVPPSCSKPEPAPNSPRG